MTKKSVVELFAGVGGFRLGLEKSGWNTIFANQWEPGKKKQWAFDCYNRHYSDSINLNTDIASIPADEIPDHELLVGGFPCQDYSVAASLATSKGIQGKKGVLWWEIRRIVEEKKPRFILLENVIFYKRASLILKEICHVGYHSHMLDVWSVFVDILDGEQALVGCFDLAELAF